MPEFWGRGMGRGQEALGPILVSTETAHIHCRSTPLSFSPLHWNGVCRFLAIAMFGRFGESANCVRVGTAPIVNGIYRSWKCRRRDQKVGWGLDATCSLCARYFSCFFVSLMINGWFREVRIRGLQQNNKLDTRKNTVHRQ